MANQAIALQARAPQQGNFLAPAIQQAGQIANRMAQQQALDRQTAVAQQQIDIAGKKESREAAIAPAQLTKAEADATAAQMDRDSKAASVLKNDLGMVESGNIDAAAAWRARAAQLLPDWAAYLPSAEKIAGNRQTQLMLAGTVEQIINKTIPTPSTVLNFAPGGKAFAITTGGVNAPRADEVTTGSVAGAPPVAPTTMTLPPAAGEQPMAAPRTPTGGMFQPISASGGQPQGADPQAALLASLMQAKQTGQIGSDVVEQLRQLDPRITPDALDAILAQNGIKVAPGGGMRSAVYRPDGNAMAPQQIANRVGTQYVGRDPTQSPTASAPGIYNVPAPQIAGAAAAEAGGKASVNVVAEPVIAGGKKKAELQAEKEIAFPDAQGQFESALATIDNRLADIKRFNEHPASSRVIGPMDAFTPNIGRARGAQAIYDALVATATLDELQQMRKASPTGGALGNVSDADIRILRQSIGALGQDQPEEDFKESLGIFESRLKQTRDQLIRRYRENYGYKLGKSWNPPTPTARAKPAGGRNSGGFTVMEVED
jgi:hypothetical protein